MIGAVTFVSLRTMSASMSATRADEVSLLQTGGLADLAARAEQRETLFGKRVRDVNDAATVSDESRPRRSPAVRSTMRGCGTRCRRCWLSA